jgi:hypothetical protein
VRHRITRRPGQHHRRQRDDERQAAHRAPDPGARSRSEPARSTHDEPP